MTTIPLTLAHTSFGEIATIAKPEAITSIEDLPDFKVMVKEDGGPYKLIYLQFKIHKHLCNPQNPKPLAMQINKAIWQEMRSKRFRAVHGNCLPAPPKGNQNPDHEKHTRLRLVETLEHLIKQIGMKPIIVAHEHRGEACHEFNIRLPRGVNFRAYHSLVVSRVCTTKRPHDGVMRIVDGYYYYIWRSAAIGPDDIPLDVLDADIRKAFRETFPFFDTAQMRLVPNVDVLKARELARLARQVSDPAMDEDPGRDTEE